MLMAKIIKLSDEQLVVKVRDEDQEFYAYLVKRYEEKLLRYANYLINSPHKAADVVQESFIKAFVNLKGFNSKKKFSSWIYRIVHNQAINYLKKHQKEISWEKNDWLKNKIKDGQDLERDLIKKENIKRVKKGLKKLDIKYREVLALFYFEEKSYEEISDILRIAIGTVGTRVNRGKKLLKLILKELK